MENLDIGPITVQLESHLAMLVGKYAAEHELDLPGAVADLLAIALARIEASSLGGRARWSGVSADERSLAGRRAVNMRWEKYRADTGRTTPDTINGK
tara:strand:+ start:205 stop:495 length:291 start_codon:yes stop_codon:yes gene_type:complete